MAAAKKKKSTLTERAEESLKSLEASVGGPARKRSAQAALGLIDVQQRLFRAGLHGMALVQDKTGKELHRITRKSDWIPDEGKDVIDEWIDAFKKGRSDFEKSVNKSFDLLHAYFKRVQKGETAAKKRGAKSRPKTKAKARSRKKKSTASRAKTS